MTAIKQEDLIQSVADALQYISYYHPTDFIQAIHKAYEREESSAAKDAMAQILTNSRMCAEGKRPICQDTGIVAIFVYVGMKVQWEADMGLDEMINEGVRQIGPARMGIFNYMQPMLVAGIAVPLLGEQMFWYHPFALVLVAVGIVISARRRSA